MAGRTSLSWLGPALVLALLAHGVVLEWVARQVQAQTSLKPLAAPLFTRMLSQANPPPVPAAVEKPLPAKTRRPSATLQDSRQSAPAAQAGGATEATQPPAPSADARNGTPTGEVSPLAAAPGPEVAASASTVPPTTAAATLTASVLAGAPETSTPTAALDSWPADTRLSYRVSGQYRGELHGDARVQWQRDGNRYQSRVEMDFGLASFSMTSQGDVTAQGLRPRAYEEQRTGRRRAASLDESTITFSDGSKAQRPEGVQDTASQFVELSHRFANGSEALEVGRSVSIWLARPGGVDLWTYDVTEREILQSTRLGPIEAFHLKPRPLVKTRGNISAEMWFAPSLQYLPVRIRVNMGDTAWVDLMVENIEQR